MDVDASAAYIPVYITHTKNGKLAGIISNGNKMFEFARIYTYIFIYVHKRAHRIHMFV